MQKEEPKLTEMHIVYGNEYSTITEIKVDGNTQNEIVHPTNIETNKVVTAENTNTVLLKNKNSLYEHYLNEYLYFVDVVHLCHIYQQTLCIHRHVSVIVSDCIFCTFKSCGAMTFIETSIFLYFFIAFSPSA